MRLRARKPHPSIGDDATAPGMRGVVLGQVFEFNPPPPERDLLGKALSIGSLGPLTAPRPSRWRRLRRVLARHNLAIADAEERLAWHYHDAVDLLLASVAPTAPDRSARAERPEPIQVRHPYQLGFAFDLLLGLDDSWDRERRFLEAVLQRVLATHAEILAGIQAAPFQFANEAKEYFFTAFKAERFLRKLAGPEERFPLVQQIHTNYFHGCAYYTYALLRRERLPKESRLFQFYCQGTHFMARVLPTGEVAPTPNPRALPTRGQILFLLRRDAAVRRRVAQEREFAAHLARLLAAFPKD